MSEGVRSKDVWHFYAGIEEVPGRVQWQTTGVSAGRRFKRSDAAVAFLNAAHYALLTESGPEELPHLISGRANDFTSAGSRKKNSGSGRRTGFTKCHCGQKWAAFLLL